MVAQAEQENSLLSDS